MLTRLLVWLACLLALVACGQKKPDSIPGQALASVNGVEITVLQLNEELARAGLGAAAHEGAGKQLLQGLIDRQLLQAEAIREKLDRDPKVMQAIDRARALIVAQAWLQKRLGTLARPTAAEVEAYYHAHPQFFGARQQFSMDQLQFPASALTPALKQVVDRAAALDEVARSLADRQVLAGRSHVARSTADLAPALAARLLAMRKGQLFAVQEGERALVIALSEVQPAPVTLALARPQIEQFLLKQRQKEAAATELARLRAEARITYLNKDLAERGSAAGGVAGSNAQAAAQVPALPVTVPAAEPAPVPVPVPLLAPPAPHQPGVVNTAAAAAADTPANRAALNRGVAGLK